MSDPHYQPIVPAPEIAGSQQRTVAVKDRHSAPVSAQETPAPLIQLIEQMRRLLAGASATAAAAEEHPGWPALPGYLEPKHIAAVVHQTVVKGTISVNRIRLELEELGIEHNRREAARLLIAWLELAGVVGGTSQDRTARPYLTSDPDTIAAALCRTAPPTGSTYEGNTHNHVSSSSVATL